jgi:hypothetical protein
VYHPSWPYPFEACSVNWKVIEVEGEPMVALSYNDNVEAAACMLDLERYLKQLTGMTCSYRVDLDEAKCAPYNNKDKDEQ